MADASAAKKQKRLFDFFNSKRETNVPVTDLPGPSSADPELLMKKTEKEQNCEKSEKCASTARVFNKQWLEKHPWLHYDSDKMYCNICTGEGKDNPFTSGCQNFRHSTLLRHISSLQHKSALEAHSLRKTMVTQTSNLLVKKNEAVISAMRCVYWLGKEQLPTIKYKSLLNLHQLQGCSFPNELQVNTTTYSSSKSAEEMQDALAGVLRDGISEKLRNSVYLSIMLDESCDISIKKKLLLYAKTITPTFDVETHFIENVYITDGTANTIFNTVKETLNSHTISLKAVVSIGSDGASVMTGSKNGFVALVRKNESPFVIGVHCMAHRLALCTSQAADKIAYLKEYQQILSDLFYFFKRSALRREKIKDIQRVLEEPVLQYKELHSVRWFSMYSALEAVYRTWASLVTYFETQMVSNNDSASKGFFKKMTTFTFIAITYFLMDVIPKVTQLSLFFQKETLDLALIRPTIDSVIQQLQWLKSNDGHFLSDFMSVASANKISEFKGIKVTDTPVQRKQFQSVKNLFLSKLISEIEKRFPAEATDIVSNMAVLCPRGLSLLSEEDRKQYGVSQLQTLVDFYGVVEGDQAPFIDKEETLCKWEKCKDVVFQQKYPCHTLQSIWKLLATNHPDAFPNLAKLAMVGVLAPLQTATVERGFSVQNNIKVSSRNRLTAERLNVLMQISLGPPVENFDFVKAVERWKRSKSRHLFSASAK